MKSKQKLTPDDHALLLLLIRGRTLIQASIEMGMTRRTTDRRIEAMKQLLEVSTIYQLIALEMIFLLHSEEAEELEMSAHG